MPVTKHAARNKTPRKSAGSRRPAARKAPRRAAAPTAERGAGRDRLAGLLGETDGGPLRAVGNGVRVPGLGTARVGTGWVPDIPDPRDFDISSDTLRGALEAAPAEVRRLARAGAEPTGSHYDNVRYCAPVEDQGSLGSCTAQSVVGMMEYMMLRAQVRHLDLSRLFLYKVTRKLMGWSGDTGAYLRTTLQAAANFGVPPERHWVYDVSRFEEEPDAFHYAYASNFQSLNYTRIDRSGSGREVRALLKRFLKAGLVAAFGFPVHSSLRQDGDVPFPTSDDPQQGGHAVLAVGYDDDYRVAGEESGTGAIVFQNSWGRGWGAGGYGFIPYRYFDEGLANDVWAVLKQEWVDQSRFQA